MSIIAVNGKVTSLVLQSVWLCLGCCLSPPDLTRLFCTHRENQDTKERRYCTDSTVKVQGSDACRKSATVRETGELCFPDLIKWCEQKHSQTLEILWHFLLLFLICVKCHACL